MQVLLINQNATIERLVRLSSGKLGYELVSAKDILDVENGAYDFVIIDSDLYNDDEFETLKEKFGGAKYLLIITKGVERPTGFDVYIEKPFLPTELVDILSSVASDAGDDSVFDNGNFETEGLGDLDEDAVFGDSGHGGADDSFAELGDFGSEPASEEAGISGEDAMDFDGLELSLDDELEAPQQKPEEEQEDDMQINLDEQMSAISDEANEINFDSDDDLSLDTIDMADMELPSDEPEVSADISLEGEDELDLEGMDSLELDMDELTSEDEAVDDAVCDMEDEPLQEEAAAQVFDEDEVNKLKNLLDETEEDKLEQDDFDMDNIKIQNDELGSLTEESLAEALGVNIDMDTPAIDESEEIGDDLGGNNLDVSLPSAPTVSAATTTNIPANAIELNPNQSITISLDALKELLNMADVTINITLSKKQ